MFDVASLGNLFLMAGGKESSWSITGFLTNLNSSLFKWGQILVVIIGIVMVIVGVFNIAKGLMSGGRAQTNWVINLLLFFLGGALAFTGGWSLVQDIAHGGYSTLQELGDGGGAALVTYLSTLL